MNLWGEKKGKNPILYSSVFVTPNLIVLLRNIVSALLSWGVGQALYPTRAVFPLYTFIVTLAAIAWEYLS